MGRNKVVSDRDLIELHRAYLADETMTMADVEEQAGITRQTVYLRWKTLGLNQRRPRAARTPDIEDEDALRAAWDKFDHGGYSQRALAEQLGMPVSTMVGQWRYLGLYDERDRRKASMEQVGERFLNGEALEDLADELKMSPKTLSDKLYELGFMRQAAAGRALRRTARLDVHPPRLRQAWCAVWSGDTVEHVKFAPTPKEAERAARLWLRDKKRREMMPV